MDDRTFRYEYSARRQAEVETIRSKYLPKDEDRLELLRRLDRSATRRATAASIAVGVVGCLLLGLGMCCTMLWVGVWLVPGVVVGILGIALLASSYPLYRYVVERERRRIAPQVLRLVDELSGGAR